MARGTPRRARALLALAVAAAAVALAFAPLPAAAAAQQQTGSEKAKPITCPPKCLSCVRTRKIIKPQYQASRKLQTAPLRTQWCVLLRRRARGERGVTVCAAAVRGARVCLGRAAHARRLTLATKIGSNHSAPRPALVRERLAIAADPQTPTTATTTSDYWLGQHIHIQSTHTGPSATPATRRATRLSAATARPATRPRTRIATAWSAPPTRSRRRARPVREAACR